MLDLVGRTADILGIGPRMGDNQINQAAVANLTTASIEAKIKRVRAAAADAGRSTPRFRPVYHHKRESIEAHLTIVFRRAGGQSLESQTGWSIKKFVRTARRYRTVQIQAGRQTLTAADRLPNDLRDILVKINANPAL
jgi:hypothetical protein